MFWFGRPYFPFISLVNKTQNLWRKLRKTSFLSNRNVLTSENMISMTSDVNLANQSKFQVIWWTVNILLSCHWWKNQNRKLKTILDVWAWRFNLVSCYWLYSIVVSDFQSSKRLFSFKGFEICLHKNKFLEMWPILTYYTPMECVLPLDFKSPTEKYF